MSCTRILHVVLHPLRARSWFRRSTGSSMTVLALAVLSFCRFGDGGYGSSVQDGRLRAPLLAPTPRRARAALTTTLQRRHSTDGCHALDTNNVVERINFSPQSGSKLSSIERLRFGLHFHGSLPIDACSQTCHWFIAAGHEIMNIERSESVEQR